MAKAKKSTLTSVKKPLAFSTTPRAPATKPSAASKKPILDSNYKFVFDPSGWQSSEAQAVRALYADHTNGKDLATEPDPQVALKEAGVIHTPTSSKGRALSGKSEGHVYSSGQDALDALSNITGSVIGMVRPETIAVTFAGGGVGPIGNALLSPIVESAKDAISNAQGIPTSINNIRGDWNGAAGVGPNPVFNKPASIGEQLRGISGHVAEGLGKVQDVVAATPLVPAVTYGTLGPIPAIASYFAADKAGVDTNLGDPQAPIAKVALKATDLLKQGVSNVPIPDPYGQASGLRITSSPTGQLGTSNIPKQRTLGDIQTKLKDVATNPNKYIPTASKDATPLIGNDPNINDLTTRIRNGELLPEEITPQLQSYKDQQGWSGFTVPQINSMQRRATANGWNYDPLKPGGIDAWNKLTPAEWLYYAYTDNNYRAIFGRSVLRAVANTGMVPAGIIGMVQSGIKAAGGDSADASMMINAALAPIKTFQSDSERYGVGRAAANAFRDHPDQVVLALWTFARTAGSVGGIAGRLAGKGWAAKNVPVTVPGKGAMGEVYTRPVAPVVDAPYIPFGQGGVATYAADKEAARVAAQAEATAAFDAGRADGSIKGTIENMPLTSSVEVGVTGSNLWDIFWLRKVKAGFANKNSWYRGKLSENSAKNQFRRQFNVAQGQKIEVRAALARPLGRNPTQLELDRVTFNLMWAGESLKGETITPGWVATNVFQKAIDDYKKQHPEDFNIPNITTGNIENRAAANEQIRLWQDQITFYQQLDAVKIPDVAMSEIRAIAKPMGDENTKIIAEILGLDITSMKRANYIRLVASNNDLRDLSKALQAERNATRSLFIVLQNRVQRLANDYAGKVTPSGVGKKNRPKSRASEAAKREKLIATMIEARDAGLRLSNDKSLSNEIRYSAKVAAGKYADAIARLKASGEGAADRASIRADVLAQIDSISLSDEAIAGLPVDAQVAYRAAQESDAARAAQSDVVAGVEAQRAAALGEVAPLSGTQPLKAVNASAINAAQNRVDAATARVSEIQSRTLPSKKELDAAQVELKAATDRLDRLGGVRSIDLSLANEKASLGDLNNNTRQRIKDVKKIIADNTPVLDVEDITISVDAATGIAGIRVIAAKEYGFFKIAQARNEILDDFIARMEGADRQALLHVMVTKDTLDNSEVISYVGSRAIDASATANIRGGRLLDSQGILFKSGQEQAKFWERLIFDTAELKTAQGWQRKIQGLIDATCIRIKPSEKTLAKAAELVASGMSEQDAIRKAFADESIIKSVLDFVIIKPFDASSKKPSDVISVGVARSIASNDIEELFVNSISFDKLSDGEYLLMPTGVYKGIQDAIKDQKFRFKQGKLKRADDATRVWRDLTLNVFPKTAFSNFVGSGILAFMAGATPIDFWYAYRAIMGKTDRLGRVLAYPPELRQRYYEQLTNRIPTGFGAKIAGTHATTETALNWAAYWMNTMRRFNGASEDLSRVAVWYSQARRAATGDPIVIKYFTSMRSLTDAANDVVEKMANNDPAYAAANDLFLQKSFDFLGDLHRGGQTQAILRLAIPFYQWYAHIFKLTLFTMPVKYPGRALFLQMLGSIGEDYVKEHGILPAGFDSLAPMYEGVVPLSTSVQDVNGDPQLVTRSISFNNLYPMGTVAPAATQTFDTFFGALNPLILRPAIALAAFGAGTVGSGAISIRGNDLTTMKKDEYGNPVTSGSALFWAALHEVTTMIPLFPSLFSYAGMADTSVPIIHDRQRAPSDVQLQDAKVNRSLWDLISDPNPSNAFMFLGRSFFGMNLNDVPGVGPIELNRYKAAYASKQNAIKQEIKNVKDALYNIHNLEAK